MFYTHFIDLYKSIFQAHQAHIPWVVIIIVARALDGPVIQEIGWLSAQTS